MRVVERATPVAAVLAAFWSVGCCLPFAFIGAAGILGLGARLQALRPWLLLLSGVLLAIGFVQLYLRSRCQRRSRISVAMFWIATAIVLLLIVFPQIVASVLAG